MNVWNAWITYIALALGLRYVLGASGIFLPARVAIARSIGNVSAGAAVLAVTLIRCPSCLGFWIGAALAPWLPGGIECSLVVSPLLAMLLNQAWTATFLPRAEHDDLEDDLLLNLARKTHDESQPQEALEDLSGSDGRE